MQPELVVIAPVLITFSRALTPVLYSGDLAQGEGAGGTVQPMEASLLRGRGASIVRPRKTKRLEARGGGGGGNQSAIGYWRGLATTQRSLYRSTILPSWSVAIPVPDAFEKAKAVGALENVLDRRTKHLVVNLFATNKLSVVKPSR